MLWIASTCIYDSRFYKGDITCTRQFFVHLAIQFWSRCMLCTKYLLKWGENMSFFPYIESILDNMCQDNTDPRRNASPDIQQILCTLICFYTRIAPALARKIASCNIALIRYCTWIFSDCLGSTRLSLGEIHLASWFLQFPLLPEHEGARYEVYLYLQNIGWWLWTNCKFS